MEPAAAKHVGAKILGEIEEESLEELLDNLRTAILPHSQGHPPLKPQIPIPALSTLISRHHHAEQSAPPPLLGVSGRFLPLLYHIVSTLIASPHRHAVVIVDADHRFDATRLVAAGDESLPASQDDLRHVYVYRPARSSFRANVTSEAMDQTQASVAAAQQHMLYGAHASRDRAWWGTVVVGGSGGDVNAGWKGWMDVRRSEVAPFGVGMSLEEALLERERRQERVRERGWEGRCREGVYSWR
ncbi:39S ribosomal protein L22, mitochondrial [Pestalotiopsis sp. IQ-011]